MKLRLALTIVSAALAAQVCLWADNAVEAEATVEETTVETVSSEGEVKADEVPADESAETASVAEEEVAPEASSDVDNSQPSDVENFRNYYGKKNKKNRNR